MEGITGVVIYTLVFIIYQAGWNNLRLVYIYGRGTSD